MKVVQDPSVKLTSFREFQRVEFISSCVWRSLSLEFCSELKD